MNINERIKLVNNLESLGFQLQTECNQYVKAIGQEQLVTDNGKDFYIVSKIQADIDAVERPQDVSYMISQLEKSYGGKTTEEVALEYLADMSSKIDIDIGEYLSAQGSSVCMPSSSGLTASSMMLHTLLTSRSLCLL